MTEEKKKRSRGVFLLPNLITTSALFSGFYAIVSSINNDFIIASLAILIAMVLDGLDGRIARLTNTQTAFGENYDSLSDMICFGLAPAIMLYTWATANLILSPGSSKIVLICCFIYVASAAIRLARFNSKIQTQDKKYFIGLASPASVSSYYHICLDSRSDDSISESRSSLYMGGVIYFTNTIIFYD